MNCTRRVCDRERGREAAHQQRLGDARHALHQHVPAAEQRDQQAGHRGVLADDGLGHLGPDGGETRAAPRRRVRRLGAARRSVGVAHAWDTSLSSSSSRRARSARSRSWAGGAASGRAGRRPRRRRSGRCGGHGGREHVGLGVGGQPQPLGHPRPGGRAQRLGGVPAVAGAAVEPARGSAWSRPPCTYDRAAARRRAGRAVGRATPPAPPRPPRATTAPGASQRGQQAGQADAVAADEVGQRRGRTRPGGRAARAAAAPRRRCRPEHLVVGQDRGRRPAASGRSAARPAARRPRRGSSRRPGVRLGGRPPRSAQPVVRRVVAAGGDAARPASSARRTGADPERRGDARARARPRPGRRRPGGRSSRRRGASGRGGRSRGHHDRGRRVGRGRVERVGAADHVDVDALVGRAPGPGPGRRRPSGLSGSRRVGGAHAAAAEPGRPATAATRPPRRPASRTGARGAARPARLIAAPPARRRAPARRAAWSRRGRPVAVEDRVEERRRCVRRARAGGGTPRRARAATSCAVAPGGRRAGRARPGGRPAPGSRPRPRRRAGPRPARPRPGARSSAALTPVVGEHRAPRARRRAVAPSRESSQPARPASSRTRPASRRTWSAAARRRRRRRRGRQPREPVERRCRTRFWSVVLRVEQLPAQQTRPRRRTGRRGGPGASIRRGSGSPPAPSARRRTPPCASAGRGTAAQATAVVNGAHERRGDHRARPPG